MIPTKLIVFMIVIAFDGRHFTIEGLLLTPVWNSVVRLKENDPVGCKHIMHLSTVRDLAFISEG